MDLTDRWIEHDAWMTRRLLERARELTDAQLDTPVEVVFRLNIGGTGEAPGRGGLPS